MAPPVAGAQLSDFQLADLIPSSVSRLYTRAAACRRTISPHPTRVPHPCMDWAQTDVTYMKFMATGTRLGFTFMNLDTGQENAPAGEGQGKAGR